MIGEVAAIFLTPIAGEPPVSVESATLESGKGLVGDRYFLQAGTFSEKLKDSNDWEMTLIEMEEIRRYNELQDPPFAPGAFRRNIITSGIRLNELVGHRFNVGDSVLEGIRLCEPCAYLGSLLDPRITKAMAHKAGLRARIIKTAIIRCGDSIGDATAA